MKTPFLLGRLIFGGFFLYNGINHIRNRKMLAQYAAAKNIPQPEFAVTVSGAMMAIGAGSIMLGVKPKLGTLAILGFLAGVSPTMHNFWKAEDPSQRQADMVNFMKNVALMGGALAMMGIEEPWPASIPVEKPTLRQQARRAWREKIAA